MRSGSALVGFLVAGALGFAVGYSSGSAPVPAKRASPDRPIADAPPPAPKKADVFKVPVGTSAQRGPADALVTIVDFSDFQCPFSKNARPTLAALEERYPGALRFVFKHQPQAYHLLAPLASEYALAAGEQGRFFEMHDLLFENQKALSQSDLDGYSSQLGLDLDRVRAFIQSGQGKRAIQADQDLARRLGASGTPTFFINGVRLTGAQPLASFVAVVDAELEKARALVERGIDPKNVYAELTKDGEEDVPRTLRPGQPTTRQRVTLDGGSPVKGGSEPLVVLVAFSDFECPFCARVNPTLERVLKTYGKDVQLVFRHQPLEFHKRAIPAAKASMAAAKQGKFWPMHDRLFANQRALTDQDLRKYAGEIGLDPAKFEQDIGSPSIAESITTDQRDAQKYGARATPTIFINGIPVRGAQPFETFKAVIDMELALAQRLLGEGVPRASVYTEILKREGGKEVRLPGSA
jgi:protein-disulfide isomerase